MFGLFKKLTKEQQQEKRVSELMASLTSDVEFEFSDLETVQIINMLRRKYSDYLENKKSEAFERSVNENQKANEIKEAISYLE